MLCARVVRGINSTENDVTPACAISCTTSDDPKGRRNPIRSLPAAHQRQIRFPRHVIRAVAEHLHNNVGGAKNGGSIRQELSRLFQDMPRPDSPPVRLLRIRPQLQFLI